MVDSRNKKKIIENIWERIVELTDIIYAIT